MLFRCCVLIIFFAFIGLLGGCVAPGPIVLPPDEEGEAKLASATGAQIVAWNRDSRWLALAGEGLELLDLQEGRRFFLTRGEVTAVAWRPDGLMVALAERQAEGCQVRIYDLDGKVEDDSSFQGECQALFWTESGLQVLESRLREFSFGGSFKQLLYLPGLEGGPEEVLVYETTIRPAVARWLKEKELKVGGAVLGASGELLIFTELRDPPAGTTYLKLMALHLPSGERWQIAELELGARAPHLTDLEEVVAVYDGQVTVKRWGVWDQNERQALTVAGVSYATSSGGRYRWLGDRLMQGNEELMQLENVTAAQFSPNGTSLLLSAEKEQRLISGLTAGSDAELAPKQMSGLQTLRHWRSRNLITAEEYQVYRQRILSP